MAHDRAIERYLRWYARLLALYPQRYRDRFGEGMEQTFRDLCRSRTGAGHGLFGFALCTFAETSVAMVREHARQAFVRHAVMRVAQVTALILLIPLVAMRFSDEWDWGPFDFVFAGGLIFGTGMACQLLASRGRTTAYRAAVGLACAASLLLVWMNAAVGFIGDGPVNLLYLGVPAVLIAGALIVRLRPNGMSRVLMATAIAQMLVPVIALAIWNPPFDPGIAPVMGLNAFFAALWAGSAWLFRRAGSSQHRT